MENTKKLWFYLLNYFYLLLFWILALPALDSSGHAWDAHSFDYTRVPICAVIPVQVWNFGVKICVWK